MLMISYLDYVSVIATVYVLTSVIHNWYARSLHISADVYVDLIGYHIYRT